MAGPVTTSRVLFEDEEHEWAHIWRSTLWHCCLAEAKREKVPKYLITRRRSRTIFVPAAEATEQEQDALMYYVVYFRE